MPVPADVAILTEATDRTVAHILDLFEELQRRGLGTDGSTFGTEHMSREDRILMFLDDAQSGALDHLKVLNPKAYLDYLKQFREDLQHSPQLQAREA